MELKEAPFTAPAAEWKLVIPHPQPAYSTLQDEYAGSGWSFSDINTPPQGPANQERTRRHISVKKLLDALISLVFVYAITIVGFYLARQRGAITILVGGAVLIVGLTFFIWNRRQL